MSKPPPKAPDECSIWACKEKRERHASNLLGPYCAKHEKAFYDEWLWCEIENCCNFAVLPEKYSSSELCSEHGGETYEPRTRE